MRTSARTRAFLLCLIALGCSSDARVDLTSATGAAAAPSIQNTNGVIALVAGTPATYDASRNGTCVSDPAASGLTYRLALTGAADGLATTGAAITGTPTSPGVVSATLTATDALGRTATDRFTIVVFAAGLLAPVLPATPFQYTDADGALPEHFTSAVNGTNVALTDNTPATNRITNAGATLGRVLFYDPRLSANDGISCASCHIQSLGFSDRLPLSVGFGGGLTARHAPGLTNGRFYKRGRFFWDERAATLEEQVLAPIQSPVEMGMSLDKLVFKIIATPYYAPLFAAAFGSGPITSDRIARALAQYTRSLVSTGSRYDRAFAQGVPNFATTFNAQEQLGEQLFRTKGCASCHTTVSQVSDSVYNVGLDATPTDTGAGRGGFKAPSLRNVAVRTHYMHDGRFSTLAQVIDFFDAGVQPAANLNARLRAADGTPLRLALTSAEKNALVSFLETLTDSAFLTAPRFASPFTTAFIPTPPGAPAVPTTATVAMQFTAYDPATVTVSKGATVTWINLDTQRHSASFAASSIGSTPIFTSGSQSLVMPTVAGSYHYQCAVHGAAMSGTVVVE